MTKKVLVVEDDAALLEATTEIVESFGYEVMRAENGLEGLTIARRKKPDLVLTGYMMPVMDGAELTAALAKDRALSPVPVVMMSASPRPASLSAEHAFISKPFDIDELRALLARLVPPVPD